MKEDKLINELMSLPDAAWQDIKEINEEEPFKSWHEMLINKRLWIEKQLEDLKEKEVKPNNKEIKFKTKYINGEAFAIVPEEEKPEPMQDSSETMQNKDKLDKPEPKMIRPDWEDITGGVILCTCGAMLQTQEQTREHWQSGHFDKLAKPDKDLRKELLKILEDFGESYWHFDGVIDKIIELIK